jgi:RecA-family ATPase
MSAADGWTDATICPICGRDSCDDPEHMPPIGNEAPRDRKADAASREARRIIDIAEQVERLRVQREAQRQLAAEERGTITPEFVTLAALLAEPEPAVHWRITDWQPADSRVILAAPRKAGKTTLTASLVRSLVDGDDWLGRYAVAPVRGTVAIVDTEMSRRQLRRWYRDVEIRSSHRVVVVPLRGQAAALDLLDPARRAEWCVWLVGREVQYLVIDCLRPVLDALGLDESREAGRWLVALDALLREAQIPDAMLVHHMGHTGERSRGDSRLRDWPDVEWRLMRQDDDDSARFLAAYGRDVNVPESQLAYDATTRLLTLIGGSRREIGIGAALDAVAEVLEAAEAPQTGRQVESALEDSDHARDTIRAALRRGVAERRLVAEDGPRRSRLYRTPSMAPAQPEPSARVRGSAR